MGDQEMKVKISVLLPAAVAVSTPTAKAELWRSCLLSLPLRSPPLLTACQDAEGVSRCALTDIWGSVMFNSLNLKKK